MSDYKVTLLVKNCNNAAEAKQWAIESRNEIVKVTKVVPHGPTKPHNILVDGELHSEHPSKAQAVRWAKHFRAKGLNTKYTVVEA